MKRKLLSLLTLALLGIGSAWADEAVLNYSTDMTISNTVGTHSSGITITQTASKNLASGKTITVNGTGYTSIKLSGGSRDITIAAPENNEITSITIYSYVNSSTMDGGHWSVESGTEITSTAGTAFTSTDNANPDVQKMVFEPASAIELKWTGNQQCAVFVVEYFSTSTSKYTLTAAASPSDGAASISSARSYYAGSTVYLTATAAAGYAFNNWTDASSAQVSTTLSWFATMPSAATTYTANFSAATTHAITAAIAEGQSTWGSITNEGENVVVEDETITFAATANEGYAFANWTKGGSVYSTESSITVTSTEANEGTYTANFVALNRVYYNLGDYKGEINSSKLLQLYTTTVNEKWADADGNYTIPTYAHKYLYNAGYVFAGWSDGNGNIYASGETITGLTADVTLSPTWTATTASLSLSTASTKITWSLSKADIVFADWQSSSFGYYTQNATVNGETIAIPMKIVNGKVGNYGRSDALAQTNQETKFTIPAVSGMTIAISDAYTNFSTTTIAGSKDYEGTGTKSISYTYTGDAETIDIIIGENNQYLTSIVVTYPKTHTFVDVTSVGYRTFASSSALDFTGGVEGLTAYRATVSGTKVSFVEIDGAVPSTTGMLLKANEGRYYIPLASGTPAAIENEFVGVTAATKVGKGAFVLYNGDNGVGFYKTNNEEFTVGANQAYLPADVAEGRSFISLFGDEATSISASLSDNGETANDKVFDLQGRRVAQPVKGLYIQDGKKIFVK